MLCQLQGGEKQRQGLALHTAPKPLEGARASRFGSSQNIQKAARGSPSSGVDVNRAACVCPTEMGITGCQTHCRAAGLANTAGNPVIWEQTMQLLTLKPQLPREVAFYQAHVRSDGLGRRLHFLGERWNALQLFSLLPFPNNSNVSSRIGDFLAKSCSVVCRMRIEHLNSTEPPKMRRGGRVSNR